MFDKLRRVLSDKASTVRELSSVPADLHNVPSVSGADLTSVDRAVLGEYLGRAVESVEPMGVHGPEATSMLGQRVQGRLREAAGDGLAPGEMVPGQAAAREERLRAQGMTDEQIAMIRDRIAHEVARHTQDGWQVSFSQGHRATVQLFTVGTEDAAEFDRLEAQWERENGTDGHRPQDTALLSATVQRMSRAPYECYSLSGKLAAKSRTHVAIAQSGRVGTPILAGLATVVLRMAESKPGGLEG